MKNIAEKFEALHASLFNEAYAKASRLATISDPRIKSYTDAFKKSLVTPSCLIEISEVLQIMKDRRLILYGDFHTYERSQKEFLWLVEQFAKRFPSSKKMFALEIFEPDDQAYLDLYYHGKINTQILRSATNYNQNWGFPFSYYLPVLEFARNHGIRIFGINSRADLLDRDALIAKNLQKICVESADQMVFCLIGESHLADVHLPQKLDELVGPDQNSVRIVGHAENLPYSCQPGSTPAVLKISSDLYCVQSSPLWQKWQSLNHWEELYGVHACQPNDLVINDDLIEKLDVDFDLFLLVKHLAAFFEFDLAHSDLTRFHVRLDAKKKSNPFVQRSFRLNHKRNEVVIYDFSLECLCEIAGEVLQSIIGNPQNVSNGRGIGHFSATVFAITAANIAAKLLNPWRPLKDIQHYRELARRSDVALVDDSIRPSFHVAKALLNFHEKTLEMKPISFGELIETQFLGSANAMAQVLTSELFLQFDLDHKKYEVFRGVFSFNNFHVAELSDLLIRLWYDAFNCVAERGDQRPPHQAQIDASAPG